MNDLLTIDEAALYLGVDVAFLKRWTVKDRILPCCFIPGEAPSRERLRIRKADLDTFKVWHAEPGALPVSMN